MADHPVADPAQGVNYLTDDEIEAFLDDLDHNDDGYIDYAEVEAKLDAAHDELAPSNQVKSHHVIKKAHDSSDDRLRHDFLKSIMGIAGDDARDDSAARKTRIPRADFAARVREWKVPSLKADKQSEDDQKTYVRRLRLWRRARAYWAVHGPEIAFLVLVAGFMLAFGIWQCVKYVTQTQYRAAFGWGVVMAKTCAGMLYPTFFFLILSMSRYFSTFLRRSYHVSRFVNWDLSQSFHIKISCVALALASLHAIGHLTGSFYHGSRPANQDRVAEVLGPDMVPRPYVEYVRSLPGFTGLTALGLFYILAAMSMPQVRRWNYEVFQLSHLLMYPIIGLMMAHGTAGLLQWPMFGYFLAFPTLLVLVERLVRIGTGFHRISATLKVLDGETVEITATIPSERIWRYQAGQYVFLQVPKISTFQWHPFTVSICKGREFQLHIKTDGNWTKRLRDLGGDAGEAQIDVGINGPFGAPAQRFYDFGHTIIVGSGIGVTPFSGILADLQAKDDVEHGGPTHAGHHQHRHDSETTVTTEKQHPHDERKDSSATAAAAAAATDGNDPTKPPHPSESHTFAADYRRVDFHWTVRDRNYLLWIADLLNSVHRSQDWHRAHEGPSQHLDIRIATHVTQKRRDIVTHVYRWLLELHRTEDHPASPLTGLLNPTHFGRPDFDEILDRHYDDMRKFRASKRKNRKVVGEKGGGGGGGGTGRSDTRDAVASTGTGAGSGRAAADDAYVDGEEEDEEMKVGVFYCGAPVVGEILADKCRQLTVRGRHDGSKIEYHFMIEVFG
ncbi:Superoxide-generating NADPH oxidase heavy chain subunit A [Colletotrichum sidae]|uniref:Superoxide-generating NADPH oxidase heavy chain subunit A n=1 Tax=Colletotrichum sidae TaxID=1347389 RepID=A0A4R8TLW2_9PEZI|nr:Superoxide-generating NADPH oxidase heavy chain subunit A [Colletotrichum sidae]